MVYNLFWNKSVKLKTLQFYQRPWMIVFGYMLKHTSIRVYNIYRIKKQQWLPAEKNYHKLSGLNKNYKNYVEMNLSM